MTFFLIRAVLQSLRSDCHVLDLGPVERIGDMDLAICSLDDAGV